MCCFISQIVYNVIYMKTKGVVEMKGNKLIFAAIAAFVFIAAAVTAIYIFRNEIADFFVDIKARIDEKLLGGNGEYVE